MSQHFLSGGWSTGSSGEMRPEKVEFESVFSHGQGGQQSKTKQMHEIPKGWLQKKYFLFGGIPRSLQFFLYPISLLSPPPFLYYFSLSFLSLLFFFPPSSLSLLIYSFLLFLRFCALGLHSCQMLLITGHWIEGFLVSLHDQIKGFWKIVFGCQVFISSASDTVFLVLLYTLGIQFIPKDACRKIIHHGREMIFVCTLGWDYVTWVQE